MQQAAQRFDAATVHAWAGSARAGLAAARDRIDAINVFPVADGDTGTNVLLTLDGAVEALARAPRTGPAEPAARALARGALLAARGNSGVIVSQYLVGLARALPAAREELTTADLARALALGARAARDATVEPQEGTALTLAAAVADGAATAADAGVDVRDALEQVVADGARALASISATHPVLRRARVPDAGACALLVLLDALARAVGGRPAAVDAPPWLPEPRGPRPAPAAGSASGAFEVMLVVRTDGGHDEAAAGLRAALQEVGDSVAVVGADGWYQVHVHTDDPAEALERCRAGRREPAVVQLVEGAHGEGRAAGGTEPHGLVVATTSPAAAAAYAAAGAVVLVVLPDAPVSRAHVVHAVVDTDARRVLVAPGAGVAREVLEDVVEHPPAVARQPGATAVVVPVDAPDELRVAVLVRAWALAGPDPEVALAALRRLRVARADGVAGLADAVRGLGPRGESLTVVHRDPLDEGELASLLDRVGPLHAEPVVLGPTGSGPAFLVGVE